MQYQPEWVREQARRLVGFVRRPVGILVAGALVVTGLAAGVFLYYYIHYARLIDEKLDAGPFANTFNIYALAEVLVKGQSLTAAGLAEHLRRMGHRQFRAGDDRVDILPDVRVEFARGKIAKMVSLSSRAALDRYELAPPLITNLSENREKRRLVHFDEIPAVLVKAVTAIEDKRFFEHGGFDALRLAKAAYVDLRESRKGQGASTITMQLARSLWLDPEKTWRRKLAEMMITAHLEQRLPKKKIFEYYANEVYLGQRGTYSIHGFGEASREYFGKSVRELTLGEAATLAGLVQRPGYFNPYRSPARATDRRNVVLARMRQNGFITREECDAVQREPLRLAPPTPEFSEAPYFMDLLSQELQGRLQDQELRAQDIYTTLDRDLQREAEEAVRVATAKLDKALSKRESQGGRPQVALVALDPETGEVRALVGGRDYRETQLNRALARRQPGSAFKPFVYAAALNSAIAGGELFTPASVIQDEPTEFLYGDEIYEPGNFKGAFYGALTLRDALARSVNIATVKLAEAVGYASVARLARQAGLGQERGTPAVALGAYDVTPLELAGAYTVFANGGMRVKPTLISSVRLRDGRTMPAPEPGRRRVLDPRVNFLVVSMMQDVLNRGTGASARGAGFTAPAAGKTGTSRDGWFAGFTSRLLCVVWMGYDDGHDLKLEGGKSALPVWTEFMKRAVKLPRYSDPKPFPAPAGIASAEIDPESGELADASCPDARVEYFVAGTEPHQFCRLHSGSQPQIAGSPAAMIPASPQP